MVEYTCHRCGYFTYKKSAIRDHLKRKKICKPNLNDIDLNEKTKKEILNGIKLSDIISQFNYTKKEIEKLKNTNPATNNDIIYIFHPREHIRMNENIYKIGRTTRTTIKRLKEYPKGTTVHFSLNVDDCYKMEHQIIELFSKKFIQRLEFGREYFEGDVSLMIKEIVTLL